MRNLLYASLLYVASCAPLTEKWHLVESTPSCSDQQSRDIPGKIGARAVYQEHCRPLCQNPTEEALVVPALRMLIEKYGPLFAELHGRHLHPTEVGISPPTKVLFGGITYACSRAVLENSVLYGMSLDEHHPGP